MDDLVTLCKQRLFGFLSLSPTLKESKMKTLVEIENEMQNCQTEADKASHEECKAKEAHEKAENDRRALQEQIDALDNLSAASLAAGWAFSYVPVVGQAASCTFFIAGTGLKATSMVQ